MRAALSVVLVAACTPAPAGDAGVVPVDAGAPTDSGVVLLDDGRYGLPGLAVCVGGPSIAARVHVETSADDELRDVWGVSAARFVVTTVDEASYGGARDGGTFAARFLPLDGRTPRVPSIGDVVDVFTTGCQFGDNGNDVGHRVVDGDGGLLVESGSEPCNAMFASVDEPSGDTCFRPEDDPEWCCSTWTPQSAEFALDVPTTLPSGVGADGAVGGRPVYVGADAYDLFCAGEDCGGRLAWGFVVSVVQ